MSLPRLYTRVLFVTLALSPCVVRADPVGFSYSWSIDAGYNYAGGPGPISLSQTTAPDGSSVTVNYGGGTTTLTVATAGTASVDPSSGSPAIIPLATLTVPPLTVAPGTFSFQALNTYTLHVTDTASGQGGDLTLYGDTHGIVSPTGTTLGAAVSGDFTGSVLLGGHTYSAVGVGSASPDIAPGDDPLTYTAQIYIDQSVPVFGPIPAGGVVGSASVPEPSSLLLAGCALSLWSGAALRKRRVRAA